MAHILEDRVKETTTTTGTGTLALLGAVSQFRAFSAVMANNDTTLYAIVGQTGTEWEVGLGTWLTGNSLARTTVLESSNAGSVVTLSAGTKNVFMTLTPAGRWPGQTFTGAITPATNDAAALGSTSLKWADLFLASGGVINFDSGDATFTSGGSGVITMGGAAFVLPAGGTVFPPLVFNQAGSLQTTPAEGGIEANATNFYGTTDLGNRGILPVVHFIRANAVRTYTSNTSAQAIFNSPANGRLTLEAGTYRFHGVLSYSAMSATSGNRNFNPVGAGTAVTTGVVYAVGGADTAVATVAAGGFSHNVALASTTSAVPAAVAVGVIHVIDGSLEVTTAGTIIPSTTMVTAAASTLAIGSFLEFWRIGTDAVVSVGQWD